MRTGARGEAFVAYDGQELPLLLTNRALAEAEKATGRTVVQIAQAAQTGAIGMSDIAELLRAGLEYGRRDAGTQRKPYTLNDAWDVMDALGFARCAEIVIGALAAVLSYRPDDGADPTTARGEG